MSVVNPLGYDDDEEHSDTGAILTNHQEPSAVIEALPMDDELLAQDEEDIVEDDRPPIIPSESSTSIDALNPDIELGHMPKSKARAREEELTNWFKGSVAGTIKSRFNTLTTGIEKSVAKSNKQIRENTLRTNRLIEERFQEGFGAIANVPEQLRERQQKQDDLNEEKRAEHWKHERKLVMKYESLDYVKIYNKSYRQELYNKFFHVSGDLEWLRWILSFVMGIFIGFIAYLAHFFITNIQDYKYEVIMEWAIDKQLGVAFLVYWVINLVLAGGSSALAVYYEPTAAGSGIPEVKAYLNGTKIPGFFRMRTLWTKLISMIMCNGASLQVGAEGPMIHIGALIGNGVSQAQSKEFGFKVPYMKHFRNDRDKRDFITSGAGAGVAAAFGAPLGGTLFSLEEVASFWSTLLTWRTFFLSMVAVFAMKLFLSIESGTYLDAGFMIFNIGTDIPKYHFYEIFPFLVIGVIGGLLGALFTVVNLKITEWRGRTINKQKRYRVREVLVIASISSFLQFLLPLAFPCQEIDEASAAFHKDALTRHYCQEETQYNDLASVIFTSNDKAIFNLLAVNNPTRIGAGAALVFFLFYFSGAMYTAGSAISSGTFVPMIVIGSAYGRMFGLLVKVLYPEVDPGIYAIMGAAAFMAGVSRLTISLAVILIEITNDLANLLPIMLVVMTAKWVADPIVHPYFDKLIEMKHIPYLEPNPTKEMKLLMCKHVMARKPKYFLEKEKIGKILFTLRDSTHNGFPIVNNLTDRRVKGLILRSQLLVLLDRMSQIWIDRTDLEYSHANYQTKLSWNLPKLSEILERFEPEDYNKELDLTPYINLTVISVNKEFAVSEAFVIFRTMGLRHLPVVDEDNKLKGVLTKKDLMEHNCETIYHDLKLLKKIDFTNDLPGVDEEDDTPITSPRFPISFSRRTSPAHSRRGTPSASRVASPAVSRRGSFSNLHESMKPPGAH